MDSSDSSIYAPSSPALSSDYSLSSRSPSRSPSLSASTDSTVSHNGGDKFPPLSLSALVANDNGGDITYTLRNPLIPIAIAEAEALLAPSAEMNLPLLRGFIAIVEPDPECASALLEVALRDSDVRRMLVERYAENKVQGETKARQYAPVDFTPYVNDHQFLLSQSHNSYEEGVNIAPQIIRTIEIVSFFATRFTPYKTRKSALVTLTSIGESILTAPEQLRNGIISQKEVGYKLGLAIEKLTKAFEGRERGSLKRDGLARRVITMTETLKGITGLGAVEWVRLLQ